MGDYPREIRSSEPSTIQLNPPLSSTKFWKLSMKTWIIKHACEFYSSDFLFPQSLILEICAGSEKPSEHTKSAPRISWCNSASRIEILGNQLLVSVRVLSLVKHVNSRWHPLWLAIFFQTGWLNIDYVVTNQGWVVFFFWMLQIPIFLYNLIVIQYFDISCCMISYPLILYHIAYHLILYYVVPSSSGSFFMFRTNLSFANISGNRILYFKQKELEYIYVYDYMYLSMYKCIYIIYIHTYIYYI